MDPAALLEPKMWLVWGPLGLYALVMTGFVIKLYRDLVKERKEYRKLEERHIAKAESWMTQYANFSTVATKVVDAAMRRYRRDSGGSP